MPRLLDLQGNPMSWAELHERLAFYYAWKAEQEQRRREAVQELGVMYRARYRPYFERRRLGERA